MSRSPFSINRKFLSWDNEIKNTKTSNFDTKPTQLLQLAPKTKIFMLRWRSSSNQTCSWQSARHRKETDRCGTAKMGMKTGRVLWGTSPVFILERI